MYIYLLILRILHIGAGVFWAGTALIFTFYVFPAAKRSGADGGKIIGAITGTNRFPQVLTLAATLTVLSGYLLMWHLSRGFTPAWFSSPFGISLGIGGTTSTIALIQVWSINRPGIFRMQAIAKVVSSRGGTPSADEQAEMNMISKRIQLSTKWIAFWLTVAVITMAGARYF